MLDGYHLLTLTHRDAPLEDLGQVVVRNQDGTEIADTLHALKDHFGWDELCYLATCNRVFYLFYSSSRPNPDLAHEVLSLVRPDLPADVLDALAQPMRLLHGVEAVSHLLEVAASMDSLVVGEREIIRQLREAYDRSRSWGLTGDHLRLLLRFTIETAKEIYTETSIGEKAMSIVALAFQAMRQAGVQPKARVLLIGAGETNALFAKFLQKYGYTNVTVFNRSLDKAEAVAESLKGRAFPLSELEFFSGGFDAMVVCTAATQPIVTHELYEKLVVGETGEKVVIDLSVPNNVDKSITAAFPLHFIEIETLRAAAQVNRAHRESECEKARLLICRRVGDFRALWHERQVERALAHIPEEVRAVKDRAVQEVFEKEFSQLDPAAQDLMLRMLGYMEKKCIAIPIKAAKAIVLNGMKQRQQMPQS